MRAGTYHLLLVTPVISLSLNFIYKIRIRILSYKVVVRINKKWEALRIVLYKD